MSRDNLGKSNHTVKASLRVGKHVWPSRNTTLHMGQANHTSQVAMETNTSKDWLELLIIKEGMGLSILHTICELFQGPPGLIYSVFNRGEELGTRNKFSEIHYRDILGFAHTTALLDPSATRWI